MSSVYLTSKVRFPSTFEIHLLSHSRRIFGIGRESLKITRRTLEHSL